MKVESDIKESLEKEVVLFVSPPDKYKDFFEKIVAIYLKSKNKLCIVSLNKSYVNIFEDLKKKNINPNNILFIDCVSKEKGGVEEKDNVFYVSSPKAFTELSILIKETLKAGVDDVVFDSLSTLLISRDSGIVIKFVRDLINFAKNNKKRVFFTLLKDDLENKAVKEVQMLMDKTTLLIEVIPAKEDAIKLMQNLFGPDAGKLVDKYAQEKKPELLLKEFKGILSKLVGPENAEKQMEGLYAKYGK